MSDTLPAGWTAHVAPTGHTYYYHAATKKSTYQRPRNDDAVQTANSDTTEAPQVAPVAAARIVDGAELADRPAKRRKSQLPDGDVPVSRAEMQEAAPWCLIYTRRGRRFFHDPSTSTSSWDCPAEIEASYERFIERSRNELLAQGDGHQDDEEEEEDSDDDGDDETSHITDDDGEGDEASLGDDDAGIAETDASRNADYDPGDQNVGEGHDGDADVDLEEQLRAFAEEEADHAPQPYSGTSIEECKMIFTQMLHDLNVNPFHTWDHEVDRLVHEDRYLALDSTRDRKAVFEQYCAQALAAQKAQAAIQTTIDPRAGFLALVAQSNNCQYFADFKRKHKHDDAYKRFGASDHDREKLFRAFRTVSKQSLQLRQIAFRALLKGTADGDEMKNDVRYHALTEQQRSAILTES